MLLAQNNNVGNDGWEPLWVGEDVSGRVSVGRGWLTLAP
jgi:hypothetical protein